MGRCSFYSTVFLVYPEVCREGVQTAFGCTTCSCDATCWICLINFYSFVEMVTTKVVTILWPQRSLRLADIGARHFAGDRIWQRILSGKPSPLVVSGPVITCLTYYLRTLKLTLPYICLISLDHNATSNRLPEDTNKRQSHEGLDKSECVSCANSAIVYLAQVLGGWRQRRAIIILPRLSAFNLSPAQK